MNDPCHSLNLVVTNSLGKLSPDIKDFITQIHSYFSSPQRRAALTNIQIENNLVVKKLKKYVKTRWLSFDTTLIRTIEIWDSLLIYMQNMYTLEQEKLKSKSKKKEEEEEIIKISYKWHVDLLSDKNFYTQINFLAYVIEKINYFNIKFQSQSLEVQNLKIHMQECYRTILKIIIPARKLTDDNINLLLSVDWEDAEVKKNWFMNTDEFILYITDI